MSESTNLKYGCTSVVAMLAMAPFLGLYNGWALWLLWNWFATAIAPPITWHQAVGLALLVGFLKYGTTKETKADGSQKALDDAWKRLVKDVIGIAVFVAVAWAFHAIGFGVQ